MSIGAFRVSGICLFKILEITRTFNPLAKTKSEGFRNDTKMPVSKIKK